MDSRTNEASALPGYRTVAPRHHRARGIPVTISLTMQQNSSLLEHHHVTDVLLNYAIQSDRLYTVWQVAARRGAFTRKQK